MARKLLIFVVAVSLIAVIYLFLHPEKPLETKAEPKKELVKPPKSSPPAETPVTVLPIATDIIPLNSAESEPADDLATLEVILAEFRRNNGGNPVGENEEITASLLGRNAKRLAYLPAQGNFLNAAGQLIDRWGTPYFFHQLSGTQTEIRSAGPDRELNTADDLVR
jgi:hypothetical protein